MAYYESKNINYGQGVGVEVEAPISTQDRSNIGVQIDRTNENIERLDKYVHMLGEKIQPILKDDTSDPDAKCAKCAEDRSSSSPLTKTLSNLNDKFENIIYILENYIGRVDI
jgi:hypothetical protein